MEERAKAAAKEPKKELRGGTGTAGPLFQLPGEAAEAEEKSE
jgi:hypothetical protein